MKVSDKVILIVTILFAYLPKNTYPQAPDTLWTRTYGGAGSDVGYSVQQTNDGGFIIAGATNSFGAGDYDIYLIKTNQFGDTLWTKIYGGADQDYGSEVQQTADGGYIVIGSTNSFNNSRDDLYLIKTDTNGDTLWTKVYGGLWGDVGRSITEDIDGNYLATGYTMSFDPGNADVWILKFNEFGDTLWTRRVGGNEVNNSASIKQLENDDYIITGYTQSFNSSPDMYLIRIDSSGDTIWTNHYGRQGFEYGEDVLELDDGGFVVAGYTTSYGTGYDCYLVRVNVNGDTLWTKHYGEEYGDKAYAIELFEDGFVLGGYTHNFGFTDRDVLIIKTDFNGDTIWTKTIGGLYNDWGFGMDKTNDNGLIITGQFDRYGDDNHDVWLIRLDKLISGLEEEIFFTNYFLYQNYPNPFNPTTIISYQIPELSFITLKVYDVLSNEIATLVNEEKTISNYEVEFDASGLPSGIYFYRLQAGSFVETKKMVLMK